MLPDTQRFALGQIYPLEYLVEISIDSFIMRVVCKINI